MDNVDTHMKKRGLDLSRILAIFASPVGAAAATVVALVAAIIAVVASSFAA